jgi:hypothetical protein
MRCVPRAPLYSPSQCAKDGSKPSNQPSTAKRGLKVPTRLSFNPRNMPQSGCMMVAVH